MRNTFRIIVALFVTTLVVVVACKKKTNNNTAPTQSLNQVFADLKTTPQNFTVTAGRDTTIFGANGTVLHFYTYSFKDANGKIISTGNVFIQLVEMCKPSDMIANLATTVTSDSLLASGGEISITATMNGQKIYANKYGIGFKQSGSFTQQMELYYGDNSNSDSLTRWTKGNNTTPGTTAYTQIIDSTYLPYYLFDSCPKFATVNCDCLYDWPITTEPTDINVIVPDESYNQNNTFVSIIFPTQKVKSKNNPTMSVPINLYNISTHTFSVNYHGTRIPVGLNYELVVITNKNGNYYYFEQSGVVTSGLTITATMAPETKGDIAARLHAL